MKTLLIVVSVFLFALMFKEPPEQVDFKKGLWAVQYNATFNKKNDYQWKQVPTMRYHYIDLDKHPKFVKASNIQCVPTIVIYRNGVELKRYEADLSLKLIVNQNEIVRSVQR